MAGTGTSSRLRRRSFLGLAGAAPLILARRPLLASTGGARVVVVGGGFAGAAVIAGLQRLAPDAELVLVDPWPTFFSTPSSLDYVFGRTDTEAPLRGYGPLEARGLRRVQDTVRAIDPDRRLVATEAGDLPYDLLVLATGMSPRAAAIPGLEEAGAASLCLYDRASLPRLREALAAFEGGRIVVSVPDGALECPPAPYEYTLLLADMVRRRGLAAEVVLLDAWPSPQPDALAEPLAEALAGAGDIVQLLQSEQVAEVDAAAGVVVTDFGDEIAYDLLSLIPPSGASPLLQELELTEPGDAFAAVDPLTLRSTRREGIYVLGDAARVPYGRTAAAAVAGAGLAAAAIAAELRGEQQPVAPARVDTACYPHLTPDLALRLSVAYDAEPAVGEVALRSEVEVDGEASAVNAERRRAWERELLAAIFAA